MFLPIPSQQFWCNLPFLFVSSLWNFCEFQDGELVKGGSSGHGAWKINAPILGGESQNNWRGFRQLGLFLKAASWPASQLLCWGEWGVSHTEATPECHLPTSFLSTCLFPALRPSSQCSSGTFAAVTLCLMHNPNYTFKLIDKDKMCSCIA